MQRPLDDIGRLTGLDDAAGVHDRDPVGETGDYREIVGDPDERGAGLSAKLFHLVDDLALDRNIEGGGRLVGNDELRPVDERNCNGDTLPHAAGKLVWIGY